MYLEHRLSIQICTRFETCTGASHQGVIHMSEAVSTHRHSEESNEGGRANQGEPPDLGSGPALDLLPQTCCTSVPRHLGFLRPLG
ncbi:unnamed protein product [Pleuronectes platessa]|uniref:Uncharacterized protein n=1 Tax=Pleuronectes platessa TaxID=8262 RepID=A0A9N7YCH9_PLEPL|nr:unnamed protein product [Pleuronectes platessa]